MNDLFRSAGPTADWRVAELCLPRVVRMGANDD
jgi:hypothetical protein